MRYFNPHHCSTRSPVVLLREGCVTSLSSFSPRPQTQRLPNLFMNLRGSESDQREIMHMNTLNVHPHSNPYMGRYTS